MTLEKATRFFEFNNNWPNEEGSRISHWADPYKAETLCGRVVGIFPLWMWGAKDGIVTCDTCERIKDAS